MLEKQIDIKNGQKLKYQDMKKNILKKFKQKPGRKPRAKTTIPKESTNKEIQFSDKVVMELNGLDQADNSHQSSHNSPEKDYDNATQDKDALQLKTKTSMELENNNNQESETKEKLETAKKKPGRPKKRKNPFAIYEVCLLYTSDAADDMQCVDLGGRRIIKKKKHREIRNKRKDKNLKRKKTLR
eukprot:TRINITY_DN32167_c0_g1_i1.p2 TRINITY_DN32167_c0_g1~~TRINITY_DN32167_c0_g1_i1.p2  ORF type:complete len:185 (-),score=51.64 TRINITY_DN32167_c0_g1_i1:12-566(-)